jgi:4-hydroxybenzoate polyprenyltransferase
MKIKAFLQLTRPANIVTSVADSMAGFAISGMALSAIAALPEYYVGWSKMLMLGFASGALYAGGVIFNDVFDAELDSTERPERPIPKGIISIKAAALAGSLALVSGVLAALAASPLSGFIALGVAMLALLYNARAKHHALLGPLTMGLCRGGNLLLGISALPEAVSTHWMAAVVPVLYIAAVTLISRGEVHGGSGKHLLMAALSYILVLGAIPFAAYWWHYPWEYTTLLMLACFAIYIFIPLYKAYKAPKPAHIMAAVKAGVIGVVFMDASWAAAFGGLWYGVATLLLFPLSRVLARYFSVT